MALFEVKNDSKRQYLTGHKTKRLVEIIWRHILNKQTTDMDYGAFLQIIFIVGQIYQRQSKRKVFVVFFSFDTNK